MHTLSSPFFGRPSPPKKTFFLDPVLKKIVYTPQKKYIKNHGNGDTIRIGYEIQYLPCAGFFLSQD